MPRNGFWRLSHRTGAALLPLAAIFAGLAAALAGGQPQESSAPLDHLVFAYPDFLAHGGKTLIWHDGTRMETDDGTGSKPSEA